MLKLQSVFAKDINEHTYEAYFEALKDWKIEYIEQAGLNFIKTETFFPLPKNFKEILVSDAWNAESWKAMREPAPAQLTIVELLKIAEAPTKEGLENE